MSTTASLIIGVDSNIIIRLLVGDDTAQAEAAKKAIKESTKPCHIDCSVLGEVVWVLERGYKYSKNDIAKAIEALLQTQDFTFEDKSSIWQALKDYQCSNIGFVDCLIGRRNHQSGCGTTLTFDKKAAKLKTFTLLRSTDKFQQN
ncbi:PIN domain-containing protein [Magnetococcales bacterium HHB-1]